MIFATNKCQFQCFLLFLHLPITTEAMGICPSADGQGECGSKTAGMHVSPPMDIGVRYGVVILSFSEFSFNSIFNSFKNTVSCLIESFNLSKTCSLIVKVELCLFLFSL